MNVTCPGCSTVFRVDPAKVPAGGVRARCSVCRAVFRVESEATAPAASPAPAAPTAHRPTFPLSRAARQRRPMPRHRPRYRAHQRLPRYTSVDRSGAAPPFVVPPPRATPARPAPAAYPSAPAGGAPHVRPPFSSRPVSIATPSAQRTSSPRPSVNPFLSKDPGQKARRLARALVSDIVVYHPEKRLEGLRHGTLKQIFDEEIKKSWEEYRRPGRQGPRRVLDAFQRCAERDPGGRQQDFLTQRARRETRNPRRVRAPVPVSRLLFSGTMDRPRVAMAGVTERLEALQAQTDELRRFL